MRYDDALKIIADHYGFSSQADMLCEEAAEFTVAYNQRATVQLNYAVLRNMYHSRKNHKLDEWSQGFTEWVESLPYSELIIMGE